MGGLVIGEFDAFVAHSLDDGATWKTTNVSESADKSSFNLANGTAYPGAVYRHGSVHHRQPRDGRLAQPLLR